MGDRLGPNLKRLGMSAVAERADEALRNTCIGRIVNLLTLIFTLFCVGLYGLLAWLLYQTGLMERVSDTLGPICVGGLILGCIVAAVLAGLIGSWLRRLIWRALLRRRR